MSFMSWLTTVALATLQVQQSFLETGNALAGVTDFPGNLATAGQYMFQAPLDPDMAGILLVSASDLSAVSM